MHHSTPPRGGVLRALALAGACTALLGCGASEGHSFTSGPPKASSPSMSTSGNGIPKSLVCGAEMVGDTLEPEIYMVSAMNNKLRAFPELAAYVGLEQVSDCASARQFVDGLVAYGHDHPGFDGKQPLDPTPVTLPAAPPPETEPPSEVGKIFNGVEGTNKPVVRLDFRFATTAPGKPTHAYSNKLVHCSGTFISKNWILTAAHCVVPAALNDCVKAGTPFVEGQCTPNWDVYGRYTIASDLPDLPNVLMYAFVHPDWIGRSTHYIDLFRNMTQQETLDTASHDLALLFINDQSILPGDVEADRAMRLWIDAPTIDQPLTFWGWGQPNNTLLRAQNTGNYILNNLDNQIAALTTTNGDSLPCPGDSGGPLVRDVTIVDNHNKTRTVPALMGVTSVGIPACPGFSDPRPAPFTDARWARVDNELPFIESRMKLELGRKFECLKMKQTTGSTAQVGECWGSPCTQDNECALENSFCYAPGRDFHDKCPTCGNAAGCGCIIGQCLKEF